MYLEACRNRAVQNFDKNIRFQNYIELYSELIGMPSSTSLKANSNS